MAGKAGTKFCLGQDLLYPSCCNKTYGSSLMYTTTVAFFDWIQIGWSSNRLDQQVNQITQISNTMIP